MQFLNDFKKRFHSGAIAKCWHACAPSFPLARTFYGVPVYMDFRDNVDDWTKSRAELEKREVALLDLAGRLKSGPVWDVGANIGLFSVRAAVNGISCVAFELSPKACRLMERTISRTRLPIQIVKRAFTLNPVSYIPPASAFAENALAVAPSGEGTLTSCGFEEAERLYGTPTLLKMDIEGGEKEFFDSAAFKEWILRRNVLWCVEVHRAKLGCSPEWTDVPHCTLDGEHVLYAPSEAALAEIVPSI